MPNDKIPGHGVRAFILAAVFAFTIRTIAQSPMLIYGDAPANGWQNWSWGTVNLANTNPVQSQTRSIGASLKYDEAVSFWHATMDTTAYGSFSFWIHGGTGGGQRLQVAGLLGTTAQPGRPIGPLAANVWTNIVIPLSQLGVANKTNFNRLWLQLARNGTTNSFCLDTVNFISKPAPSPIHISVNATQTVRSVDSRWFGANTAIWDGDFDTFTTSSLIKEMGLTILRFPGGSASDDYHWQSNKSGTNTWQWVTSFSKFAHIATNVGAQAIITVNYGSGTPAEAAGWVRQANVINKFGFKYWEIGNENYGTWENDTNALKNHAYTYATRAKDYFQQMKAVDPTIKIGVVAAPGENSYQNGYSDHPTVNPRTGTTNYGWTPILLKTLKNLGVTPDFVVHHHYPQWTDANNPTGSDSDDLLLQGTAVWREQVADLRQQITDYFGAGGTNIELVVTENNSDAGAQGRQSTSLVNGLYYADSLGQLMQTEFNAFVWWDLRNGTDTTRLLRFRALRLADLRRPGNDQRLEHETPDVLHGETDAVFRTGRRHRSERRHRLPAAFRLRLPARQRSALGAGGQQGPRFHLQRGDRPPGLPARSRGARAQLRHFAGRSDANQRPRHRPGSRHQPDFLRRHELQLQLPAIVGNIAFSGADGPHANLLAAFPLPSRIGRPPIERAAGSTLFSAKLDEHDGLDNCLHQPAHGLLVDDHESNCWRHPLLAMARAVDPIVRFHDAAGAGWAWTTRSPLGWVLAFVAIEWRR